MWITLDFVEFQDSVLAFAIELLESLAECNPRAFASLKVQSLGVGQS